MSNPLSLFPIALAAAKGRIDGLPAASAVAAGFTLLQRSAALVRALAGRRSAILLPPSAAVLTALAASDGRGAVLLPALASADALAALLDDEDVGAVFSTSALQAQLPPSDRAVVLLDGAPRSATVIARGTETTIDLGSHFGLDLEGEEDEGRDEEFVIRYATAASVAAQRQTFTHRDLFTLARFAVDATSLRSTDHALALMPLDDIEAFALSFAGPLLAGARVSTMERLDADEAVRRIRDDGVTHLVGEAALYAAIADALEHRGPASAPVALRACTSVGSAPTAALQDRWRALTGVDLRVARGIQEAPRT
ncbi:MAG: AMP-binding protein [Gemmatimonadaceae bacterium]|nr:AMP-binding protein [Gemmatimonadaceae bacterium]